MKFTFFLMAICDIIHNNNNYMKSLLKVVSYGISVMELFTDRDAR